MPALTMQQPWAWAISHERAEVENRSWTTEHRGLLAIHANTGVDDVVADELRFEGLPVPTDLVTDAFVAMVFLEDIHHSSKCRRRRCSPWADPVPDIYHWELAGFVGFHNPVPYTAARGDEERLWTPPKPVLAEIRREYRSAGSDITSFYSSRSTKDTK